MSGVCVCVCVSVEAAEGRTAHNNGWNSVNGMASNHVFDVFDTIPLIPTSHYHELVLTN